MEKESSRENGQSKSKLAVWVLSTLGFGLLAGVCIGVYLLAFKDSSFVGETFYAEQAESLTMQITVIGDGKEWQEGVSWNETLFFRDDNVVELKTSKDWWLDANLDGKLTYEELSGRDNPVREEQLSKNDTSYRKTVAAKWEINEQGEIEIRDDKRVLSVSKIGHGENFIPNKWDCSVRSDRLIVCAYYRFGEKTWEDQYFPYHKVSTSWKWPKETRTKIAE